MLNNNKIGKPLMSGPAPAGRIMRHNLLTLLDQSAQFPLTLLLAPAGYGKSTLLQQWQTLRPSKAVVRLTVQRQNSDAGQFFQHLIDGLRQVVPDFDTASYSPFSREISLPPESVAESLRQALQSVPDELFIILDDFQDATAPEVQKVIAALLEQLPPSVHFILASRTWPQFSLSRLRLEERLFVIDGQALHLNEDQIHEMNRLLGGEPLTPSQVKHLVRVTEGWIAGIKIALLAHARSGKLALKHFNGSQPEIMDYFADVVLGHLAPSVREFFLWSSIFDEFNAELCSRVFQRSDSAALLERLTTRELFLQPLDGRPGWFRYHTLLLDFLRNRLAIEQPDLIGELHQRAASHLLEIGEPDQALHHAQQAQSPAFFIESLARAFDRWLKEGDFESTRRWSESLSEEQILTHFELFMPLVSALTLSRCFNQARYYLDALQDKDATTRKGRLRDDSTLAFLHINLQMFQTDTEFLIAADIDELLETCSHRDIRAFCLAIAAYHHLLNARFEQAMNQAMRAKAILAQLGYHYLESFADLIVVLCDRATGRLVDAVRHVDANYRRYYDQRHTPCWINATTAVAVIHYEQNQLAEAQQLCEELIPVVGLSCATEVITAVYLTLARILSLRGLQNRSSRLIDQLSRILSLGNYDRFISQVAEESLRQALSNGVSGEPLERLAQQYRLRQQWSDGAWQASRTYDERWERYGLATAYWLMAKGEWAEADKVLAVISAVLNQNGVKARALVVDANRIMVDVALGNDNLALQQLSTLIDQHDLITVNRRAFDEVPGLGGFMARAHRLSNLSLPKPYLDVFADVLVMSEPAPLATAAPVPAFLTAKEQSILDLLRRGFTNTEISQHTGTALSTTKWHLKNIYTKLGVNNRTEAAVGKRQEGA